MVQFFMVLMIIFFIISIFSIVYRNSFSDKNEIYSMAHTGGTRRYEKKHIKSNLNDDDLKMIFLEMERKLRDKNSADSQFRGTRIQTRNLHAIQNGEPNSEFNRNAAKNYAEKHAVNPNLNEYPYIEDNDCTNFASQVLVAGGLKKLGNKWDDFNSWYCNSLDPKMLQDISITWRAARYFRRHWGNECGVGKGRAFKSMEMTVQYALDNFDDLFDMLREGDVIQYGDPQNDNHPYHTTVIHDRGYNTDINRNDLFMAQHSTDNKNISLYKYLGLFPDRENRHMYIYKIKDD